MVAQQAVHQHDGFSIAVIGVMDLHAGRIKGAVSGCDGRLGRARWCCAMNRRRSQGPAHNQHGQGKDEFN